MIGLIFGFNADWCHASSLTGANEPASVPLPEHRHHKKLCFQDTGEQIRVLVRMHQSKCSVSSLLIHLRYHSDESRSLHLISGTNQRPIFPQQVFHPPAKSHKEERMPKTWSKYLVSCWYFQVQEKKEKEHPNKTNRGWPLWIRGSQETPLALRAVGEALASLISPPYAVHKASGPYLTNTLPAAASLKEAQRGPHA